MKEKTKYRINQKQAAAEFDRKLGWMNIGYSICMYIIVLFMLFIPFIISYCIGLGRFSFLEIGDFEIIYTSEITNEKEFVGFGVLFAYELLMLLICLCVNSGRYFIAGRTYKVNQGNGILVYSLLRFVPSSVEELRKRRMKRVLIISFILYVPGVLAGIWLYFNPVNVTQTWGNGYSQNILEIEKQYYFINEIFRFLLMFVLPMANGYLMNLFYESALYRRRKIK